MFIQRERDGEENQIHSTKKKMKSIEELFLFFQLSILH
jgi:hypothetical protein